MQRGGKTTFIPQSDHDMDEQTWGRCRMLQSQGVTKAWPPSEEKALESLSGEGCSKVLAGAGSSEFASPNRGCQRPANTTLGSFVFQLPMGILCLALSSTQVLPKANPSAADQEPRTTSRRPVGIGSVTLAMVIASFLFLLALHQRRNAGSRVGSEHCALPCSRYN